MSSEIVYSCDNVDCPKTIRESDLQNDIYWLVVRRAIVKLRDAVIDGCNEEPLEEHYCCRSCYVNHKFFQARNALLEKSVKYGGMV